MDIYRVVMKIYHKIPKNSDTGKNAVIILKFEQCGFIIQYWVQKKQTEWQTSQTLIILLEAVWCKPQHDKTNKTSVRPAKTQISLGICPVWSESDQSLRCALNG